MNTLHPVLVPVYITHDITDQYIVGSTHRPQGTKKKIPFYKLNR